MDEIFLVLISSERQELKQLEAELKEMVPPPVNSTLQKQDEKEAKEKYLERQQKGTKIVPPTCTGKYKDFKITYPFTNRKAPKAAFLIIIFIHLFRGRVEIFEYRKETVWWNQKISKM